MIILEAKQGTPEWHAHRAKYFNASDAPAMMGVSKYKKRSELLKQIATGITPDVDPATQNRFDEGHRVEALARPLAEEIIGDDLYPVTGSEGKYSSSFDGLTLDQKINFEHKSLNNDIRNAKTVDDLDMQYKVQMEQQHLVSGCEKTLFMATKWDGDKLVEKKVFWYESNPKLRQKIINGWDQLEKDLAEFQDIKPKKEVKAAVIQTLPSLALQVKAEVTQSNLPEFKIAAMAYIDSINTTFVTDEDFVEGEANVKFCKNAEDNLEATKKAALAQAQSLSAVIDGIDAIKALIRDKRLFITPKITSEKENRKYAIVKAAEAKFQEYLKTFLPLVVDYTNPNWSEAVKNKRTIVSMQESVDQLLNDTKLEVSELARKLTKKHDWFNDIAADHKALFPDLDRIVYKEAEDFQLLVNTRIKDFKEDEAKKAEAAAQHKASVKAFEPANNSAAVVASSGNVTSITRSKPKDVSLETITPVLNYDEAVSVLSHHFQLESSYIERWLKETDF